MKVLVDTSVWSLVLRRRVANPEAGELSKLIEELKVAIIGPIRQELLSGIPDPTQFAALRERLSSFPDTLITSETYELAASFFNTCRTKGIQGSHTDFLICAVAVVNDYPIYAADQDFENYAKHLPIRLFVP